MDIDENNKLRKSADTIMSMCLDFLQGGFSDAVFKQNIEVASRSINNDLRSEYDEMFKAGVKSQLEQMLENDHKNGWNDIDILFAIMKISDHVPLCRQSYYQTVKTNVAWKMLRKHSSDIANLAQMLILKCDKEILK